MMADQCYTEPACDQGWSGLLEPLPCRQAGDEAGQVGEVGLFEIRRVAIANMPADRT